eukprot:6492225-Amphidinium_carterae.3
MGRDFIVDHVECVLRCSSTRCCSNITVQFIGMSKVGGYRQKFIASLQANRLCFRLKNLESLSRARSAFRTNPNEHIMPYSQSCCATVTLASHERFCDTLVDIISWDWEFNQIQKFINISVELTQFQCIEIG